MLKKVKEFLRKLKNRIQFYIFPFWRKELTVFNKTKYTIMKDSHKRIIRVLKAARQPYKLRKEPSENLQSLILYSSEQGLYKTLNQFYRNHGILK